MADRADDRHASASPMDADGVRVIAHPRRRHRAAIAVLAAALTMAGATWLVALPAERPATAARAPSPPESAATEPAPVMPTPAEGWTTAATPAAARSSVAAAPPPAGTTEWTSGDPSDLASWFQPGDPEPTMREVIETLHEMGIRTGLAAFNPPGTSPPLLGLAVPPDFPLPPGYVRHHQVTDDGVPLEAILMFAPDVVLHDASGRVIPLPQDRVVPPEYAPPGLPLRRIELPTP